MYFFTISRLFWENGSGPTVFFWGNGNKSVRTYVVKKKVQNGLCTAVFCVFCIYGLECCHGIHFFSNSKCCVSIISFLHPKSKTTVVTLLLLKMLLYLCNLQVKCMTLNFTFLGKKIKRSLPEISLCQLFMIFSNCFSSLKCSIFFVFCFRNTLWRLKNLNMHFFCILELEF